MLPSATRPLGCTDTTVPGGRAPVPDRTPRCRSPRPARYSRTVPTGRPSRAAGLTLTIAGPCVPGPGDARWLVVATGDGAAPPPARASSPPARATRMAAARAATHPRRPGHRPAARVPGWGAAGAHPPANGAAGEPPGAQPFSGPE